MPHTPATHLIITPKCAYINGELISAAKDILELSTPSPTGVQAVTLTITPTTVTILNDDDPDTINATHEAVTRTTQNESGDDYLASIAKTVDMLNTWKQYEATRAKRTRTTH